MPKGNGKNYSQLTKKEKDIIVGFYCNGKTATETIKENKITKRAFPLIMQEYNINTKRKNGYTLNESFFKDIDTPRKAYWLGFIAADGCITDSNYFAIGLKDEEPLLELKKDLNYSGDVYSPKSNNGKTYYRINFSSKIMCDDLMSHGIFPKKSMTYNDLPKIRHGLIRHFIRGYFDGDGCVSNCYDAEYVRNRYSFSIIATKPMCEKLSDEIYSEIGYRCPISKHSKSDMYYVRIHSQKAIKDIFYYMYHNCDLFLNRKYTKFQEIIGQH